MYVAAAIAGNRAPTKDDMDHIPMVARATKQLVKDKAIKIEISGRNWRQITIMTGQHAGKSTAPNPNGMLPHRVLFGDQDLTHGKTTHVKPSTGRPRKYE